MSMSRMAVFNQGRIKPHLPDGFTSCLVILFVHRAGQDELGFPLRGIDLNRVGGGRPDQDSILAFFGNYQCAFFDAKLAAESGRHHDGAPFPDFANLLPYLPDYPIIRHAFSLGALVALVKLAIMAAWRIQRSWPAYAKAIALVLR